MNQTKKRLSIIEIAISITDIETIQLQILKLSLLKGNFEIQRIIDELRTGNYIQAQELIATYIDTSRQELMQRVSPEDEQPKIAEESKKEILDFSTLGLEYTTKGTSADKDVNHLVKDTLLDDKESDTLEKQKGIVPSVETLRVRHKAIPYIEQKFKNMSAQYPVVHDSSKKFSSVDMWLLQICNKGYTDNEVEEMMNHILKLTKENKLEEAGQLLLISGATQSKFAQFILARELYKGKILQKNIYESFTLISRLAMNENYPEAICDLAQFYENGIGAPKNKVKAEALYMDAMNLGAQRAIKHHKKIHKENKSFFSFLKRDKNIDKNDNLTLPEIL